MGAKFFNICAAGLLVSGCLKQQQQPGNDAAESAKRIQATLDRWAKAFDAKDVDGVMAMYAPGAALTSSLLISAHILRKIEDCIGLVSWYSSTRT